MRRFINSMHQSFLAAMSIVSVAGTNMAQAARMAHSMSRGAVSVEVIIMAFVAIIILYQLIGNISEQNAIVQTTTNVSAMAKFASGLGEWMFPLLGILAIVFMLWRRKGSSAGA